MENKTDVFKALGDSNRLRILSMLKERELCVCEIYAVLNISMSTISSHLKILRNAGLVSSRKDGRWIIYSLDRSDEMIISIASQAIDFLSKEKQIIEDNKALAKVSPENCSAF